MASKNLYLVYYYGPEQTRGGPRRRYFRAEHTSDLLLKAKEEVPPGCKVTSIYLSLRRDDSVLVWDRKKGYREVEHG